VDRNWSLGPVEPGLVSVIIPAYNVGCFLAEAFDSVLRQTYRPIECIVVDDGSTDETAEVAARTLELNDPYFRTTYIRQRNQGAQAARNCGVKASRGEYIQYLDGDDLLTKDKIEAQVNFLASACGQGYGVAYGDARFLLEKRSGFQIGEQLGTGCMDDPVVGLLGGSFNPSFSYLCRRSAVQASGPWNPAIKINQDFEYFLRMACKGFCFCHLPRVTGFYRKHSGSRISDQGMLLRARTTLTILKSAENIVETANVLTPVRRYAFAKAYRNVSCWTFTLDRVAWKESLGHSLRLCPDLSPEQLIARYLQKFLGVWNTEALLGTARRVRENLRRAESTQRVI